MASVRQVRHALSMLAMVAAIVVMPSSTADARRLLELEFLGQQIIPTGTQFAGTEVGGLSGLAYDEERNVFYALSDDPSQFDPARFYTLQVDVSDGRLDDGDVELLDVTTLLDNDGEPFAPFRLDPEGIALIAGDQLVVTSEGIANQRIDPFIRRFNLDGRPRGAEPVPSQFLLNAAGTRGVRQNLGFESAAAPDHGRLFFTANEGALVQDGPPATVTSGSPVRVLRYHVPGAIAVHQFLYWTDPIAEPPVPAGSFAVSGLVELLPLTNNVLLTMERSFSVGAPGTGNTIRLYQTRLSGADNISRVDSLQGRLDGIRPLEKELVLDVDQLGIPLDNVEGMAFGPDLPDGRRSLLLVSDNNFSPAGFTQFLMFAVSD